MLMVCSTGVVQENEEDVFVNTLYLFCFVGLAVIVV